MLEAIKCELLKYPGDWIIPEDIDALMEVITAGAVAAAKDGKLDELIWAAVGAWLDLCLLLALGQSGCGFRREWSTI